MRFTTAPNEHRRALELRELAESAPHLKEVLDRAARATFRSDSHVLYREPVSTIGTHMWSWLALLNRLDGRGARIGYG